MCSVSSVIIHPLPVIDKIMKRKDPVFKIRMGTDPGIQYGNTYRKLLPAGTPRCGLQLFCQSYLFFYPIHKKASGFFFILCRKLLKGYF